MSEISEIFSALEDAENVPEDEWNTQVGEHGEIVSFRQEAFYDITVYADGYEDRFYVGD